MMGKLRVNLFGLCLVLLGLNLAGCGHNQNEIQGYVDARFAYISDDFSGILETLSIQRGTSVKAGDALFVLEQQPESAEYKQAEAKVHQAEQQVSQNQASLAYATASYLRQQRLLTTGSVSKDAFDNALSLYNQDQANMAAAQANLIDAQANLEQASWTLDKKTVVAKQDGLIFDTYFQPGEMVPAGQPVLSMLAADQIKVVFFVPEPKLGSIKLGQSVAVQCDSCVQSVTANITFISPQAEYTPPIIYSNETNDKLVYRIEAKPIPRDVNKLHPGQPVTVKLSDQS